jgi:hypothetical protein
MLPVPFQELSSHQFFTTEEQLTQLTAALKEQFGRHCFIKIHQQKTVPMRVPFVTSYAPPEENMRWYEQKLFSAAKASRAEEVDAAIAKEEQALSEIATRPKTAPRASKPSKQASDWSDILGKE